MNSLSFYAARRVLISGWSGYLASSLLRALSAVPCTIVAVSRTARSMPPMLGRARLEQLVGDYRDRNLWERALADVEVVFHLAAQTSTASNNFPELDRAANVEPVLAMLEVCRLRGWRPTILLAGTATELGIPAALPVGDEYPACPTTIYDLHKLMAGQYLRYYAQQGLVQGATLRLANLYGPGPGSSSADRGVLNAVVRRALQRQPLTIYGSGDYLRDYIFIDDIAAAFLAAGSAAAPLAGEAYLIGSGRGWRLADAFQLLAARVAAYTGYRVPVIHIEPPRPQLPIERRNFVADPRRFTGITGWQPTVDLPDGLDRTIRVALAAPAAVA